MAMARPKYDYPTPAELEVLKIVWEEEPCTVRDVMGSLNKRRAYTSVMSLLNVMTEKGLLKRTPRGRAFVYSARVGRTRTLGQLVTDLVSRGFEGSPSALVANLLDQTKPTAAELEEIRETIDAYTSKNGRS
jgi:predicted transcriptional regulator